MRTLLSVSTWRIWCTLQDSFFRRDFEKGPSTKGTWCEWSAVAEAVAKYLLCIGVDWVEGSSLLRANRKKMARVDKSSMWVESAGKLNNEEIPIGGLAANGPGQLALLTLQPTGLVADECSLYAARSRVEIRMEYSVLKRNEKNRSKRSRLHRGLTSREKPHYRSPQPSTSPTSTVSTTLGYTTWIRPLI